MKSLNTVLIGLAVVGLALFACANVAEAYTLGPNYLPAAATASTSWGGTGPVYSRDIRHTADGTDRYTTNPDDNDLDGPSDDKGMWMCDGPGGTPPDHWSTAWAKYDLGDTYELEQIDIYNYNENGATHRGVATMDIWTSTLASPSATIGPTDWTLQVVGQAVPQAPNSSNPADWVGKVANVTMGGVSARHVALTNLTNIDSFWDITGLNEVEIYQVPEPSTVVLLMTAAVGLAVVAWRRRRK